VVGQGSGSIRGGIYCRVPHIRDEDQTSVDVRERLYRERAAALGVQVPSRCVYIDARRSAWKRRADRPGWSAMLAAAKVGVFETVLLPLTDLLLYHPWDVLELLDACAGSGVIPYAPDDVPGQDDAARLRRLRDAAVRACRMAESMGRGARAAHETAAAAGRPHGGGRRPFGYQAGMRAPVPAEAAIVAEVFARFLGGATLRSIAGDLNARQVPTASGGLWSTGGIARLLDAPRYAGLRVLRGQVARDEHGGYRYGAWEPCVSIEDWERARAIRQRRRPESGAGGQTARVYPLTGIVVCSACGHHMVGSPVGNYRMYVCGSANQPAAGRCTRQVSADTLESYVGEQAAGILEGWDAENLDAIAVAAHQLADDAERGPGAGSAGPVRTGASHETVVIRPMDALVGVRTGPGAGLGWSSLSSDRKAIVLRLLFAAIRIGPKNTARGVFDYDRVEIIRQVL